MTEVEREIRELHEFFEGWLGGRLDASDATFERLAAALAPTFHIVSPTGEVTPREKLLAGVRMSHGRRSGLEIEVRHVEVRLDEAPWILVSYEEWQREEGRPDTGRISSALFRRRGPSGLEWHHVHETWIEGS